MPPFTKLRCACAKAQAGACCGGGLGSVGVGIAFCFLRCVWLYLGEVARGPWRLKVKVKGS